jgi:hypothetical protein
MPAEPVLLADDGWQVDRDDAGQVVSAQRIVHDAHVTWTVAAVRVNAHQGQALVAMNGYPLDALPARSWDSVVRVVLRWAANLDAGRPYYMRLRPLHNFYADRAWSPPGARLHLLLLPGAAHDLAERFAPLLGRWSPVLRVVPATFLHITLAWLPAPIAAELTTGQRQAVHAAFAARLNRLPALAELAAAELGVARVTSHSVRCALDAPGAELVLRYAQAATHALRSVVGANQVPDPSTDPHLALAYGTAHADATDLHQQLQHAWPPDGITLQRCRIVLTDADTFADNPWRWTNTSTLAEDT